MTSYDWNLQKKRKTNKINSKSTIAIENLLATKTKSFWKQTWRESGENNSTAIDSFCLNKRTNYETLTFVLRN